MAMTALKRGRKKKVPHHGTKFFTAHYPARRTSEGILCL